MVLQLWMGNFLSFYAVTGPYRREWVYMFSCNLHFFVNEKVTPCTHLNEFFLPSLNEVLLADKNK